MKTLNATLAANLTAILESRQLSAAQLGKMAKVSPRTIANYLGKAHAQPTPTSGKERSAKLAEVEMIARALQIPPLLLLLDRDSQNRLLHGLLEAMADVLGASAVSLPSATTTDVARATRAERDRHLLLTGAASASNHAPSSSATKRPRKAA